MKLNNSKILYCFWLIFFVFPFSLHAETPTLIDIPQDITLPAAVSQPPKPGIRVRMTTTGWEKTSVYHTLYLPEDWSKDRKFPVIVEFPGNSVLSHGISISHGTPESCVLGYGLTSGREAVWVCLPFIDSSSGFKQNATVWWGDVEETKRYLIATIQEICERYGGDPKRIVLAGFSRGAIACFYIGLHDDEVASLWAGFFCHSHFDGVRENWGYPQADRISAFVRLKRLGRRPVWISQEGGYDEIKRYLDGTGISGNFTFVEFPFPNHTAHWVLRDVPIRAEARRWLQNIFDETKTSE